jgi:hypothetical protein
MQAAHEGQQAEKTRQDKSKHGRYHDWTGDGVGLVGNFTLEGHTMLTRKVFEEQAAIIKKHLPKVGREFSHEMASDLADYFERENPRFDRERFLEACGL